MRSDQHILLYKSVDISSRVEIPVNVALVGRKCIAPVTDRCPIKYVFLRTPMLLHCPRDMLLKILSLKRQPERNMTKGGQK